MEEKKEVAREIAEELEIAIKELDTAIKLHKLYIYPCKTLKSKAYWDGYCNGWDAAVSNIRAMYGLNDADEK